MSLNTMIVAAVTNFSGTTTPDKNGETPVMLQCIAGQMPNRNVLSGTVARRAGFEVGKTYLVNVREQGFDEIFGPDYTWIKIMELSSGLDIAKTARELGEPRILTVVRPEGFESVYQRKGDAVESNRAKRIKEGSYAPAYSTTIGDHTTAHDIKRGSSQNSGGTLNIHALEDLDMEFPDVEQPQDYMPDPGNEDQNRENISSENEDENLHSGEDVDDEDQNQGNDDNRTDLPSDNKNQRSNADRPGGRKNR